MSLRRNLLEHTSKRAINEQLAVTDLVSLARSASDSRQPVFFSRAEAVTYLQRAKNRTACGGRFQPRRSHIAVVMLGDDNYEVLHATKGWKRGIH